MTPPMRASDSVWHVQHLHTEGTCRQEHLRQKQCKPDPRPHLRNTPAKTADGFIYLIFNGAVKPESVLVSCIVQHQEENHCDKQKARLRPSARARGRTSSRSKEWKEPQSKWKITFLLPAESMWCTAM